MQPLIMKKKKISKKTKKENVHTDPEYIQKKIYLIEKGLPIDVTENELVSLEETFRGARSFYVDILQDLETRKTNGEKVDRYIVAESRNLAGIELALRKIDQFRLNHRIHILKTGKRLRK